MLGYKSFAPQLLSVCLPIMAVVFALCFTSELIYFISLSTQERAGEIPKKDDKKAADTFNVITDFNRI